MVRATVLRNKNAVAPKPDTVNASGGLAYKGDLKQDALSLLTTSVVGNSYTMSQEKISETLVSVTTQLAKTDPNFLAKAVVYARNEGLMRLAPIVGLAALTAFGHDRGLTQRVFNKVIVTPDDLREFVTLFNVRVFGKRMTGWVTKMVADWLNGMSEYHAVKYGSKASKEITIRDILRLAHPKPVNPSQDHIFHYLTKGVKDVSPTEPELLKIIWAAEKLKRTKHEDEIVELVTRFKLPWEVVIPTLEAATPKVWAGLASVMPYFALVRNLATLDRQGAFRIPGIPDTVATRLSDPSAISKSRMFPFRFFQAERALPPSVPVVVRQALKDALETSVANLPPIKGKVVVAVDESGSMSSPSMGDYSDVTCSEIARLLAAILYRRYNAEVLVFNTTAVPSEGHRGLSSVLDVAKAIDSFPGGTDLASPVRLMMTRGIPCDTYVCLSDNESYGAYPVAQMFRDYRAKYPKFEAKGFLFNLSPTGTYQASISDPLLRVISGFGDQPLKMIGLQSQFSGRAQIEYVEKIDIDTYTRPDVEA